MLEWGPHEATLWKRKRKGKSVPALDNKPQLWESNIEVWEAFDMLHRTRTVQLQPDPLKLSDIVAALDVFLVRDREVRRTWVELIFALDDAWLSWARKKMKEDENRANPRTSDKRKRR